MQIVSFSLVSASIILCAFINGLTAQEFMPDSEGETIYCYQCNSGIDIDCANLQPNDASSFHYKPCLDTEKYNGSQPFCRKIVQKILSRENLERVIRKCGWVKHPRLDCYNIRNEDHIETICQCFSAGCNGSPSLHRPMALVGLLIVGQLG